LENKEKNINEVLRNKFLDYQVTPPPVVWKNIENELNTTTIFTARNIIFATIALLLIALPITYFSLNDSTNNDKKQELQTVNNSDVNKTFDYNKEVVDKSRNTDSAVEKNSDYKQGLKSAQNNSRPLETEKEKHISSSKGKATIASINNEITEVSNTKDKKHKNAVNLEDNTVSIITLEEGFNVENEKPDLLTPWPPYRYLKKMWILVICPWKMKKK